ncbi:MAG: pilus assembly protein PilP [Gammaproteobacteria bacterium]|nr:pilus assembly protein PilP [Gammaproteobacteria bacterium]
MNELNSDKQRITRALAIAVLALVLTLSSCADEDLSDLQGYVESTKSKYQGTIEPLPAFMPYESYKYHGAQLRDPFKPSVSLVKTISITSRNGVSPDAKRAREELEKYALESLTMVGVMHNQGLIWGIIKAPDNTIYRVRKGNYMGHNHGRITRIRDTEIKLQEIVSDGSGGWVERPNTLTLSE